MLVACHTVNHTKGFKENGDGEVEEEAEDTSSIREKTTKDT